MSETIVQVLPRYPENTTQANIPVGIPPTQPIYNTPPTSIGQPQAQLTTQLTTQSAPGWFTSIYDNKLIVLIIFITIILIGIIAYVVFRKPDEESSKAQVKSKENKENKDKENKDNKEGGKENNTEQQKTNTQSKPNTQKKTSTDQLKDILGRSKGTQQTIPPPAKTEDEILQLMEDENGEEVVDDVENDVAENEVTDSQQEAQEPITQQNPTSAQVNDQCTMIGQHGKRCRNGAKTNGRCRRHGG